MKASPPPCVRIAAPELNLQEAVYVKSAELWLKLGQPAEALLELNNLSAVSRNHPWALKVIQKAYRLLASGLHVLV